MKQGTPSAWCVSRGLTKSTGGVVAVVTLSVAVARRLVMQRFTARPPSPGATPPLLFEGLQKLRLPVVMVVALYGAPHGH